MCNWVKKDLSNEYKNYIDNVKYEKIEYIFDFVENFIATIFNRYNSYGKELKMSFEDFILNYSGFIFDELMKEYRYGKPIIYFDISLLILFKYWVYGDILLKWYKSDKCIYKDDKFSLFNVLSIN